MPTISPIKGLVYRLVKVDACGVPVTGASSAVFVSKFVQVQQEAVYEDGEEFKVKNADGTFCVNESDDDQFTRLNLTVDLCAVDPYMVAVTLGARVLDVGSPLVTGAGFALAEGATTGHFSLEVWQAVAGSSACDAEGNQQYLYSAWPHVYSGRIGNYTIANAPSQFQIVAKTKRASTLWGSGPGSGTKWLAPDVVEANDHWLPAITITPPPAVTDGATLLT
jgi:hypothetical protein